MIVEITHHSKKYAIDFTKPIDISIAVQANERNVNAWYQDSPRITPVIFDGKQMLVSKGAAVNFRNIQFNPHAHITHTECVGHITESIHSITNSLQRFFFLAEVISVTPEKQAHDWVISKKQLQELLGDKTPEAVVIRTLPNLPDKKTQHYSYTNPPYLSEAAAVYLRKKGVQHVLIDLPSVDKEQDGGKLLAHQAFWNTQDTIRFDATITELIYVPNHVDDGTYFLNLMIAPFENDATPSKPILYLANTVTE